MNKAAKKETKTLLHDAKQQGRKLDLLLAESERQAEILKNLQDNKSSIRRNKSLKI